MKQNATISFYLWRHLGFRSIRKPQCISFPSSRTVLPACTLPSVRTSAYTRKLISNQINYYGIEHTVAKLSLVLVCKKSHGLTGLFSNSPGLYQVLDEWRHQRPPLTTRLKIPMPHRSVYCSTTYLLIFWIMLWSAKHQWRETAAKAWRRAAAPIAWSWTHLATSYHPLPELRNTHRFRLQRARTWWPWFSLGFLVFLVFSSLSFTKFLFRLGACFKNLLLAYLKNLGSAKHRCGIDVSWI